MLTLSFDFLNAGAIHSINDGVVVENRSLYIQYDATPGLSSGSTSALSGGLFQLAEIKGEPKQWSHLERCVDAQE